jgi:hypothetical protein
MHRLTNDGGIIRTIGKMFVSFLLSWMYLHFNRSKVMVDVVGVRDLDSIRFQILILSIKSLI